MKNILFLTSLFVSSILFAQQPKSFDTANLSTLITHQAETFDLDIIKAEDAIIAAETGRDNCGRVAYEKFTMNNAGVWTTLEDGSSMWRFEYETKNAMGTSVYFDNYFIPEGAELYIYTADKSYFVGPYGAEENNDHGKFVTDLVPSSNAVLEYYQPTDVVGNARLDIMGFGHYYQGVYEGNDDLDKLSDPCEVDVNCPEGDGWESQRDAVVRLSVTTGGFIYYCSGTLVNNTAQDCKNYVLTALHCVENFSDDELGILKVRFNYERSGCGTGSSGSSHNRTGVFLRADSNDGGGTSGSDFALLELEDDISSSWDIYYAGWDVSGTAKGEGVGIHHPAGDRKKISTFTSFTISATYISAFGAHWRVTWSETETNHGVTEGGSSGSPIFNSDKQIMGTLTGGSSYCETPNDPDFYGKMSYHWTSNPNPSDEKLKVWLDPLNTNQTTLDGQLPDACTNDINELLFSDVSLFPNPTNDIINFSFSNKKVDNLQVFNALGILVNQQDIYNNNSSLDMSSYSSGIYYLTFTSTQGYQVTKKVTKI